VPFESIHLNQHYGYYSPMNSTTIVHSALRRALLVIQSGRDQPLMRVKRRVLLSATTRLECIGRTKVRPSCCSRKDYYCGTRSDRYVTRVPLAREGNESCVKRDCVIPFMNLEGLLVSQLHNRRNPIPLWPQCEGQPIKTTTRFSFSTRINRGVDGLFTQTKTMPFLCLVRTSLTQRPRQATSKI
jgi:hypothetical protein